MRATFTTPGRDSREKDVDGLRQLLAEEFVSSPPGGPDGSKEEYLGQVADEFQKWDFHDVHYVLERCDESDGAITAYLTKKYTSSDPERRHHFTTTAQAREVLRDTPDGLKLAHSDGIKRDLIINGRTPYLQEIAPIGALMQQCNNPEVSQAEQ